MAEARACRFRTLVIEDDALDREAYVKAMKGACAGRLWLDIEECGTRSEAEALLRGRTCPFISLDQRLPETAQGVCTDQNGVELERLTERTQPFRMTKVLTAHAGWKPAVRFTLGFADYLSKKEWTAARYGAHFVDSIGAFVRRGVWERAGGALPAVLADPCMDIVKYTGNDSVGALDAGIALWETALRLLTISQLAVLRRLGIKDAALASALAGRLDNGPLVGAARRLAALLGAFVHERPDRRILELCRFFGDERFLAALDEILIVRNTAAHTRRVGQQGLFDERLPWFVQLALGVGFWAINPLLTGVRVVARDGHNALQGTALHPNTARWRDQWWPWDDRVLVHPDHVYQVVA